MKKITVFFCILLAAILLCACNERDETEGKSLTASQTGTETVTEAVTVTDTGKVDEPEKLLTTMAIVEYSDSTGFGVNLYQYTPDDRETPAPLNSIKAFIKYIDADQIACRNDQVKISYYDSDLKNEETKAADGTVYPYTLAAVQAVTLMPMAAHEKPVIYLYPEEDILCSVRLGFDGELTCTYPDHGENGWENFTARPDGTLIFPDGKEYYCLYWEGRNMAGSVDFSTGFCVKGSDTAAFLEKTLAKLGLTAREANEFIIYWLPRMQDNQYNLISFDTKAYTESAKLMIDPSPDTLIRVFMSWKGLDAPVEIEEQTFGKAPVRSGFTVVEWGGSQLG